MKRRRPLFAMASLLIALGIPAGVRAQEAWSFEQDPSTGTGGVYPLQPMARPAGNTLGPADPVVTAKTSGKFALVAPALMFDGDVKPFEIDTESWTLSGWFHQGEPSGSMTGTQSMAGTRQSPSRFKGWDLNMVDGTIRFLTSPPRGAGKQFVTPKRYDDEGWHFFQLVWDGSARTIMLYVDGEKAGSAAEVPLNVGITNRTFTIGAKLRDVTMETFQEWQGEFDEWKFEPGVVAAPAAMEPTVSAAASAPLPSPSRAAVAKEETSALRLIPLPGQIALTWRESAGTSRVILASDQPINEANRAQARVIATDILPHSANDWYEDPAENPKPFLPTQGWKLGPSTPALPREDGAFVYTFRADDPASLYFAVASEGETITPGRNSTTTPLQPSAGAIQPIAQSPEVVEKMKTVRPGLPVLLVLHAHTGRPSGALSHVFFGDASMGWREGLPFKFKVTVTSDYILVEPYDRVWINRLLAAGESSDGYDNKFRNIESWWYGTNDRINSATRRKEGMAVNYTERWLLWMLDWVIANYHADANHVYAFGTSMGSGIQRLVLANPNRFATVNVLVPFFDWTYVNGSDSNARRLQGVCGPMSMPTAENKPLADRMNLVKVVSETRTDLPFVIARTGRNDRSVFWPRKPDYFRAMNANRLGLLASWDEGDHSTAGRKVVAGFPDALDVGWYLKRFAINKSFLALSDCSLNNDYGDGSPASGVPEGFINRGMDWEILADQPDRYQARLFCLPDVQTFPVTCSVTPRRVQNFAVAPGAQVLARVTDPSGRPLTETTVTADEVGRVTVPGVSLPSTEGVTLTLQKASHVN